MKEFLSFLYGSLSVRGAGADGTRKHAFLKVISEDSEENTGDATFFPGVEIDGILLMGDMSKGYAVKLKEISDPGCMRGKL